MKSIKNTLIALVIVAAGSAALPAAAAEYARDLHDLQFSQSAQKSGADMTNDIERALASKDAAAMKREKAAVKTAPSNGAANVSNFSKQPDTAR